MTHLSFVYAGGPMRGGTTVALGGIVLAPPYELPPAAAKSVFAFSSIGSESGGGYLVN